MNTPAPTSQAAAQHLRLHPARLVHLLATVVLFAAVCAALAGFFNLAVAAAVALVLTLLLKMAVQQAADALLDRRWAVAALWVVGALAAGVTTMSLTAASLYVRIFADSSAVHQFTVDRERVERELQAQLAPAARAQAAMQAWKDDASHKAEAEAKTGGTCANKPDTRGVPGAISRWRGEDAKVATALLAQIERDLRPAGTSLTTLQNLPSPTRFHEVAKAMAEANRAIDAVGLLLGPTGTAKSVDEDIGARRNRLVEMPDGKALPCIDASREQLIDATRRALEPLAKATAAPRMKPGVDLAVDNEVWVRSWLRAYNTMLMVLTAGRAGSFADDPLMAAAVKQQGIINRETLNFLLASLAEMAMVLSTLTLRAIAPSPFPSQRLWPWMARPIGLGAAHTTGTGRLARVRHGMATALQSGARWVVNLLYVQDQPLAGDRWGPVAAAERPAPADVQAPPLTARQRRMAELLVPWLVETSQGHPVLCLPAVVQAAGARHLAHELAAEGALRCLTTALPMAGAPLPDDLQAAWDRRLGKGWRDTEATLFEVGPAVARLLRWAVCSDVIDAHAAYAPIAALPAPGTARDHGTARRHRSLRARLAERGLTRRAA